MRDAAKVEDSSQIRSNVGRLFKPLALAVTFGMVGSYILAMLIIPAFSATFLKTPDVTSNAEEQEDTSNTRETPYLRLIRFLVARPFVTILLAVLLLGTTVLPFSQLGWEFFPRLDQDQFTVFVRAPSGTRIELTEKLFRQVERSFRRRSWCVLIIRWPGIRRTRAATQGASRVAGGTVSRARLRGENHRRGHPDVRGHSESPRVYRRGAGAPTSRG